MMNTKLVTVALLTALREEPPLSVAIATLLDKPDRRRPECADIPVKYTGFIIPDFFVVGYGMDAAERYRNLPYVGVLEES